MLQNEFNATDFNKMAQAKQILPGTADGLDSGEFLAYWLIEEGLVDKGICFHYLRRFYRLDTDHDHILSQNVLNCPHVHLILRVHNHDDRWLSDEVWK